MMPDSRNSMPMAMVSHVTPSCGYLMSNTPTTMAQAARKMELWNIFIACRVFAAKIQNFYELCTFNPKLFVNFAHDEGNKNVYFLYDKDGDSVNFISDEDNDIPHTTRRDGR